MGTRAAHFFLARWALDASKRRLVLAIEQHASSGSEANAVINLYHSLSEQQRQDLLNFLRSL